MLALQYFKGLNILSIFIWGVSIINVSALVYCGEVFVCVGVWASRPHANCNCVFLTLLLFLFHRWYSAAFPTYAGEFAHEAEDSRARHSEMLKQNECIYSRKVGTREGNRIRKIIIRIWSHTLRKTLGIKKTWRHNRQTGKVTMGGHRLYMQEGDEEVITH